MTVMGVKVDCSWRTLAVGLALAVAGILFWIYYTNIIPQAVAHGSTFPYMTSLKNAYSNSTAPLSRTVMDIKEMPPCGKVCEYGGTERTGKRDDYKQITKEINCPNIMGRMAWDKYEVIYPPLKEPPAKWLQEYTQNGQLPLGKPWYLVDFKPQETRTRDIYTRQAIEDLLNKQRHGESISSYGPDNNRAITTITKSYDEYVRGKRGFVIGTQRPWVEVILLDNGAGHVTTLEYNDLDLQHPNLSVIHPVEFAKQFREGKIKPFDFGVSFSSIEHSGLGRYGDPLNPYGDLEAMAQNWCMLKPGGFFLLGLPYKDPEGTGGVLRWNAARFYSRARLSEVAANFDLLGHQTSSDGHAILTLTRLGY